MTDHIVPSDTATGAQLRDEAIADVLAADTAPHRGAGAFIQEVIDELAKSGREFTAEDVRDMLSENTVVTRRLQERPNVLPANILSASRAGRIAATGYTTATRPSRHASVLRTWRGLS